MYCLHLRCGCGVVVLLAASLVGCGRSASNSPASNEDASAAKTDAEPKRSEVGRITLAGHTASIRFVKFSGDGNRLLTGSTGQMFERVSGGELKPVAADDRSGRVWDAATGKELARFEQHQNGVGCGAISPDGTLAATADGSIVRVWKVAEKPEQQREFKEGDKSVVALAFSTDGKSLAAASDDGMVRIWETTSGNPLAAWQQRTVAIGGLVFSPNRKYLASASTSGIEVWDPERSIPLRELQDVSALAAEFAGDSKRLLMLLKYEATERPAAGTEVYHHGVTLHEWDIDTGMIVSHEPLISRGVEQAAIAPGGSRFIVGGLPLNGEMPVQVYDIAKRNEVAKFDVPHAGGSRPEPVVLIAFAPGGRKAAIAVYRDIVGGSVGIDAVQLYDLPE
jgi:WD40 repeat protein